MFYKTLDEFKNDNGYEINGTWYPRVTSIISIKAKPALLYYYAGHKSYKHAQDAMNRSAQEGTDVHKAVEAIMDGKRPAIPDHIAPAVAAYTEFAQTHTIHPLKIETQIVSNKHGYAGTIDVLAEVDGKLGVLDIKTSQSIYRDYGIQTAAYVEALREDASMPELTRWILRLDQYQLCMNGCGARQRTKGGNTKIKNANGRDYYRSRDCVHMWGPIVGDAEIKELDNLKHDTKAFLAAKQLWEWEHNDWLSQLV